MPASIVANKTRRNDKSMMLFQLVATATVGSSVTEAVVAQEDEHVPEFTIEELRELEDDRLKIAAEQAEEKAATLTGKVENLVKRTQDWTQVVNDTTIQYGENRFLDAVKEYVATAVLGQKNANTWGGRWGPIEDMLEERLYEINRRAFTRVLIDLYIWYTAVQWVVGSVVLAVIGLWTLFWATKKAPAQATESHSHDHAHDHAHEHKHEPKKAVTVASTPVIVEEDDEWEDEEVLED